MTAPAVHLYPAPAHPDLLSAAAEIRAVNAMNGWGHAFNPHINRDTIGGYLALIHTEVTEAALEEKAAAQARELGDVIVRALDLVTLCIGAGATAPELYFEHSLDTLPETDMVNPRRVPGVMAREYLRLLIDAAMEDWRKVGTDAEPTEGVRLALTAVVTRLFLVVAYAAQMIRELGGTPSVIVAEIVEKNRQRGLRHGGRRT